MNENEKLQDDEISLFDFWEKLLDGWRYLVGGTLLGLVGAGMALMVLPTKYEAVTTLQVARIAGVAVEEPVVVIERFKSPAFLLEVAKQVGNESLDKVLRGSSMVVSEVGSLVAVKGSSLLQLTTKGASPEAARKLNEVVLQGLIKRHEFLGLSLKAKISSDVRLNQEKISVVERELGEVAFALGVAQQNTKAMVRDVQFAPLSLLTSQQIQKQAELFALRQQLAALELSLLPPAMQPTQPLEETYIPEVPVSPKKGRLLAFGLIGGLLAGVLAVFFVDVWRRVKLKRLG
jgi:hypothetical protein